MRDFLLAEEQRSGTARPITGTVFNVQRFSTEEGPGIRTAVFMKGCPLRCHWCHNPEGLSPKPQLVWHDVRMQIALSENVIKMGVAVEETGEALALEGRLPLVGGGISEFADRITAAGAEVEASGRESRDSITRVALVSGIGVGVLPVAMVLLMYLPLRLGRRTRMVRAVASLITATLK